MNGRAIPGAEMNTFRLTNVFPERIIFVSRGITVLPFSITSTSHDEFDPLYILYHFIFRFFARPFRNDIKHIKDCPYAYYARTHNSLRGVKILNVGTKTKTKLRGFSPRANHTDRAAAAGRRS